MSKLRVLRAWDHRLLIAAFVFVSLCLVLPISPWSKKTERDRKNTGKYPSVLVFYFPQLYEVEERDKSWVKGFTDLTLVKQVRRSRVGQPVIRPGERSALALWAYNQEWESHRRFQGNLAGAYGIDGFVMMHYWFDGHAVMDAPLQGRLKDGQPAIPFCLLWVNEPKGDGIKTPLNHTDTNQSWVHFQYLLPFFLDPGYIKVQGKPLFLMYKPSDIPDFSRMVLLWNELLNAGTVFPGLHVVQMLRSEAEDLADGSAGFVEYYPDIFQGEQWPVSKMLSVRQTNQQAQRYYGVSAAWDNTPRHPTDGREIVYPNHPSIFQYTLQQNLARTNAGGFVFVNAWNRWGEGAAIEPSIEWGRRWLEAVRNAKENIRNGHFMGLDNQGSVVEVRLPPAGVSQSTNSSLLHSVCIIVCTSKARHETWMFNIHQFISTLVLLKTRKWDAFFVNTDAPVNSNLRSIIASYSDERLNAVVPPSSIPAGEHSLIDWAITGHCNPLRHHWLLVTNADNWYTPDALNYLPSNFDMVLMNFYGRYTIINEMKFGNGTALDNCCERFGSGQCFFSAPRIGFIDLGAVIFSLKKFMHLGITFQQFNGSCGGGACDAAALIQALGENHGWSYDNHEMGVCAMYCNPSPQSCTLSGGVYFDSVDFTKADCYDISRLPIPWHKVNWDAWINSDLACVCERYERFNEMLFAGI